MIPYINENNKNRDNNVDFRIFRSHPLVKISESEYFIYNLPLLCERLYNSMFFDLKEYWSNGDFFQFYNKTIVEHQIFQYTMLKCVGSKTSYFYPSKDEVYSTEDTPESPNQPDFFIRENNAIILFECKGIKISGCLKDRADVDSLIQTIKNKLYLSTENYDINRRKKSKDEYVGVTQLVNQINLIEDDNFPWDPQIPDDVAYYPVLVLEDSKLSQIGLGGIINSWYQPVIKKELADTMSHPIIVMSIDILFLYSDTFEKLGFQAIFDSFFKNNIIYRTSDIDWQFNPIADFNTFMRETFEISPSKMKYGVSFLEKIKKH